MIRRGDLVYIDGRLDINEYEKDGEKKKYTSVIVGTFSVLKHNGEQSVGTKK